MLCESLMARAAGLGVEEIYLLTMNAAGFFERLGFNRVDRSGVPVEIQRTREFSEFCPASAVVMYRDIR
jgi:N-acetylglutamate synthase-like GNAT family acetyltransferase